MNNFVNKIRNNSFPRESHKKQSGHFKRKENIGISSASSFDILQLIYVALVSTAHGPEIR